MVRSSTDTSSWWASKPPRIGLAYCSYVPAFLRRHARLVDFVEVPFERLRVEPECAAHVPARRIVLHSASMSLAGAVRPPMKLIRELAGWVAKSGTPWVGEHLSFVTAPAPDGSLIDVGYSVAPPLNEQALRTVARAYRAVRARIGVPLLLENPPTYFDVPGSTMTQPVFLRRLADEVDASLLLDLTHLEITAANTGVDAEDFLAQMPLHRVVEVHVSGASKGGGLIWDDHANRASRDVFRMLASIVPAGRFQAVTLEYNWSSRFPEAAIAEDLRKLRRIVRRRPIET